MSASSALQILSLTKVYKESGGGKAGGIRDASFDLPDGSFFTLLGPSGCGKTTTLRCIAGLEFPDSGQIKVGDRNFFDSATGTWVPMNLRKIGMVFQSYAIWPHMTVFENVAFPLRVSKDPRYSRAEIEQMVGDALRTVSLDGYGDRPATRLSGGQQQRVALARAIVRKPRLLLLDEPLSNLDATLREEMRNELKRLQQQIGITTVYVTHDQTEALEMSDTIAVIDRGQVVQMGSPREIYFNPVNAFVAGFVGTTNIVSGKCTGEKADGVVTVSVGGGQSIDCLARNGSVSGQDLKVSVRPENITLVPTSAKAADGHNLVTGEVVLSSFVGNMNRYMVKVSDATVEANASPHTVYPVGSQISMMFPVQTTLAFPAS
jgi:iron(III) transport system ATP-binding protein